MTGRSLVFLHDSFNFFSYSFPCFEALGIRNSKFWFVILKADEAARESRQLKQDRYADMRRKKDEEREAKERQLVSLSSLLFWFWNILSFVSFLRILTLVYPGRRS